MLKILTNLIKAAKDIGLPDWIANELVFIVTLLALLISIGGYLVKGARWLWLRYQQRRLDKDLAPYFTRAEINKATQYFIPTKYQNIAPSLDEEPGRMHIASAKSKLIPLFLNTAFNNDKDDTKYYLILADSGMGKTTFMINLYLKYIRQWFWKKRFDILLLPLGNPEVLAELEKCASPENTILLLDAFDEDVHALKDYNDRIGEILKKTWKFREIVITCRTQFFPTEDDVPHQTGRYKYGGDAGEFVFQKLYVSVFNDKDVKKYLRLRYNIFNPFTWKKHKRAKSIARKSPNLVVRPMLLSNITTLVEEDREYEYAFEIYEVLIDKWMQREAGKNGIQKKYGSKKAYITQLRAFSKELAVYLYNQNQEGKGLFIDKDAKISNFGLQLSDIEEDIENQQISLRNSELRSRSLLNRNADGLYKFSHKSILEYFLAKEIIENDDFSSTFDFTGMDATESFVEEMAFAEIQKNAQGTFRLKNEKKEKPISQLSIARKDNIEEIKITNSYTLIKYLKYIKIKTLSSITLLDKKQISILYALYLNFIRLGLPEMRERIERIERIAGRAWREEITKGIEALQVQQSFLAGRQSQKKEERLKGIERLKEIEGMTDLKAKQALLAGRQELKERELRERIKGIERLKEIEGMTALKAKQTLLAGRQELKERELRERLKGIERLKGLKGIERVARLEGLDLVEQLERIDLYELHGLHELHDLHDLDELHELHELHERVKLLEGLDQEKLLKINYYIIQCQSLERVLPSVKIFY